ncbi:MAG: lytic transglycosylase domain-containing protein [Proteobacteria bacterium]|nr:lytic transglycosylase domain-containing protein [Pseudomonadota bacterium]
MRTPPPAGGSATGPVTAGVVTAAPARAPSASLPAVGAGAFRYTRNGIAFITTTPPPAGATDVLLPYILVGNCHACDTLPDAGFGRLALNTTAYATEIATAAQTWGVDEWLVRAIIHAESGFNPNAVSNKGAQGLMQLMPGTATRFGVRDALVAADNIRGGVQYLALLTQRYHGDIRLIAAAYDAGEENVDRYGGVPPFAETQRYVDRVVALAARYRGVN